MQRITELVRSGVEPSCITAVTFTRKAAREVSERVTLQFADMRRTPPVRIGTFHSICMQILQAIPDFRDAVVIDESERTLAIEEAIADSGPGRAPASLTDIAREISLLKSRCIRPGDPEVPDWLSEIYLKYDAILSTWNCLDYDDLILKTLGLWASGLEVVKAFDSWFRHLLVDEFQDVNEAQFRLTRAWSSRSESLFIIGDPDQSIYGFRGSSGKYFNELASGSTDVHQISFVEGYRSQSVITKAANAVIRHNRGTHAEIAATRRALTPIIVSGFSSDRSEAVGVVKEIERLVGGTDMLQADELGNAGRDTGLQCTYGFSDIAVLYRTGRQGDVFEECFAKAGIEVFRWLRCLRLPKYSLTREGLRLVAREVSNWRRFPSNVHGCYNSLRDLDLCEKDREKLSALIADLHTIASGQDDLTPRELVERCIRVSGQPLTTELMRLIAYADEFMSISEFNKHILLGKEADWVRIGYGGRGSEHVSLLTIHAAKGLEFAVVFVTGCEEGLLPLIRSDDDCSDVSIEEERRLFYVAMTRAKDLLYLTHAKRRSQRLGDEPRERSRFVSEIPADCVRTAVLGALAKPSSGFRQASLFLLEHWSLV